MACSRTSTWTACWAISAALIAGCGSDDDKAPPLWGFTQVTSVEFTDRVPQRVRRTCDRAARETTVECPDIVPRGGVVHDHNLYGFLYSPTGDSYALTFNNGDNRGHVHWMIGGGASGDFERRYLDQSTWVKRGKVVDLGTRECAGHDISGYRLPRYPAGGPFGSHAVALSTEGDREYWASVHGRDTLDASVALLLDTLRVSRPLQLCGQP